MTEGAPVVEDNIGQPDLIGRYVKTPYPAVVVRVPRQTKVVPLLYTLRTLWHIPTVPRLTTKKNFHKFNKDQK